MAEAVKGLLEVSQDPEVFGHKGTERKDIFQGTLILAPSQEMDGY